MPRLELRLDHYQIIRNFMDDFEPMTPEDALTPQETETLDLVKQIIVNIEKRRAEPKTERRYPYRKHPPRKVGA
jgi:hypothetical protein